MNKKYTLAEAVVLLKHNPNFWFKAAGKTDSAIGTQKFKPTETTIGNETLVVTEDHKTVRLFSTVSVELVDEVKESVDEFTKDLQDFDKHLDSLLDDVTKATKETADEVREASKKVANEAGKKLKKIWDVLVKD